MKIATVMIFLMLVLLFGGICLQIFLSKRQSKWFGLILPAISFAYSILLLLNLFVDQGMGIWQRLAMVAAALLGGNIPTMVLLGIYFACREKVKRRTELDKMNVQDLN